MWKKLLVWQCVAISKSICLASYQQFKTARRREYAASVGEPILREITRKLSTPSLAPNGKTDIKASHGNKNEVNFCKKVIKLKGFGPAPQACLHKSQVIPMASDILVGFPRISVPPYGPYTQFQMLLKHCVNLSVASIGVINPATISVVAPQHIMCATYIMSK